MNSFSLPDKGIYDIVVTKHTDPGWTPLFGLCKGIIVEHGGLLSHASIISRELNLPCIIGLKNATKLFKDGQTITINGFSGEVTIHD
jgi:pyruvate,water dikinase